MFFVPDKLKIVLKRQEEGIYHWNDSELYEYNIPRNVLNLVIQNAIMLIQRVGTPSQNIGQLENGVNVQTSGDFRVVLRLTANIFCRCGINMRLVYYLVLPHRTFFLKRYLL